MVSVGVFFYFLANRIWGELFFLIIFILLINNHPNKMYISKEIIFVGINEPITINRLPKVEIKLTLSSVIIILNKTIKKKKQPLKDC